MKTVKMGELTVLEIRQYLKKNKTIILPYGAVEQHGYHLPLDTDIRNATMLSEKLAEKLGYIVAPTLNYSFSGGMLEGTVNVRPNTFSNMVCEIIESLVSQGFMNIIIVPGHGGSESLLHLKESLRIMKWLNKSLQNVLILFCPLWEFSPTWVRQFKNRDYHAGYIETSLIMYWAPKAVRKKIALDVPAIAGMLRNDPDSYQVRSCFTSMKHEIPSTTQNKKIKVGVMGYPHKASPAIGRKVEQELLDHAVLAIRKTLQEAVRNRKKGRRITLKDDQKLKILSV